MKRYLLLLLLVLTAAGLFAQSLKGKTVYVAVKSVALKSSTGFFASTRGTLDMGASATVLNENGKWVEIRSSSVSGWVASSSVTTKKINPSGGTSASASELALAGKGFSQEVENAYKQSGDLDYRPIDAMEAQTVDLAVLKRFLEEGHLAMGE